MISNMHLNGIISPSGVNYILRNVPITIVGYFFVVRITYEWTVTSLNTTNINWRGDFFKYQKKTMLRGLIIYVLLTYNSSRKRMSTVALQNNSRGPPRHSLFIIIQLLLCVARPRGPSIYDVGAWGGEGFLGLTRRAS